MTIPNDNVIKQALLLLLNSKENKRIHASDAYKELALLHPELTDLELNEPYQNSVSKWANRVQFARLHLANEGLLFKANRGENPQHGYWIITPEGEKKANNSRIDVSKKHDFYGIDDIKAIEGYRKDRTILVTHRNQELANKRKEQDDYTCQVCKFKLNLSGVYIIECHHLNPISIHGVVETSISDLISLCPTCHRIAHLRNPPYTPKEIKKHITMVFS